MQINEVEENKQKELFRGNISSKKFFTMAENKMNMQINLTNKDEFVMKRKLDNTLAYWDSAFASFERPNVVMFTSIKENKIVPFQTVLVLRQLLDLKLLENLEGINALTNAAYLYIRFDIPESAELFRNMTLALDEAELHYVDGQRRLYKTEITVDSVPPVEVCRILPEALKSFVTIDDISPSLLELPNGKSVETSPTILTVSFKDNVTIKDIPMVIQHDKLKITLKVKGRRSVCFVCEKDTHIARDCPYRFCSTCRGLRLRDHRCMASYASKVRLDTDNFGEFLVQAAKNDFPDIKLHYQEVVSAIKTQPLKSVNIILQDSGTMEMCNSNQELPVADGTSEGGRGSPPLGHVNKIDSLVTDSFIGDRKKVRIDTDVSTVDDQEKTISRPQVVVVKEKKKKKKKSSLSVLGASSQTKSYFLRRESVELTDDNLPQNCSDSSVADDDLDLMDVTQDTGDGPT